MQLVGINPQQFDHAGYDHYRLVSIHLSHQSDAVVALFDSKSRESFTRTLNTSASTSLTLFTPLPSSGTRIWLDELHRDGPADPPLFLVACKCDEVSKRTVPFEFAQEQAFEYGAGYLETSALTGEGMEELFHAVVGYGYIQLQLQPTPYDVPPFVQNNYEQKGYLAITRAQLGSSPVKLVVRYLSYSMTPHFLIHKCHNSSFLCIQHIQPQYFDRWWGAYCSYSSTSATPA